MSLYEQFLGKRGLRVLVALLACVAMACLVLFLRQSKVPSEALRSGPAQEGRSLLPDSSANPVEFEGVRDTREGMVSRVKPTEEDLRQVESRLQKAETVFKTIERENTEILGQTYGAEGMVLVAAVAEPNSEQVSDASDALTAAFADLPDSVRIAVASRREKLMAKYMEFYLPFKILEGFFPYASKTKDGSRRRSISFGETDLRSKANVTIIDNGVFAFTPEPFTTASGGRGFADGGVSRYGYLFEEYFVDQPKRPSEANTLLEQ